MSQAYFRGQSRRVKRAGIIASMPHSASTPRPIDLLVNQQQQSGPFNLPTHGISKRKPRNKNGKASKTGGKAELSLAALSIPSEQTPNRDIPLDVLGVISEFLAGDLAFGTLASLNVANHGIREETLPILYETVVFDDIKNLAYYGGGGKVSKPTRFKYTKYYLRTHQEGVVLFNLTSKRSTKYMGGVYNTSYNEFTVCLHKPVTTVTAFGKVFRTPMHHEPFPHIQHCRRSGLAAIGSLKMKLRQGHQTAPPRTGNSLEHTQTSIASKCQGATKYCQWHLGLNKSATAAGLLATKLIPAILVHADMPRPRLKIFICGILDKSVFEAVFDTFGSLYGIGDSPTRFLPGVCRFLLDVGPRHTCVAMATVYGNPDLFSRAKGSSELLFSKKILMDIEEPGQRLIDSHFGDLDDGHDNRM
ncbi:hypothetical protein QFC20_005956 [Naganishia adeliensis]|uniref:Uncharacterized protein n=1 Tax=Naganishia adeliensis TaxID=92952 RepID=A0ACC2VGM8_9TREE|nr:hypothetical protein QFC20_005956 [Naganishia adeliensis]